MRQAGIFIESLMPAHDRSWTVFVELDLGSRRAGWGGKFATFPFPHLAVRYPGSFTGPSHLDYSQKLLVLLVLIALQSKQIILAF